MIPLVCATIIDQICASFIFEPNENGLVAENVCKTIAKFMNTIIIMPNMPSHFEDSLKKLLAVPVDSNEFERNLSKLLTVIDEEFFKCNQTATDSIYYFSNKFTISSEFINCILAHIQMNANTTAKSMRIPSVFYNVIFWPLTLSLDKAEVSFFLFFHCSHFNSNLFTIISCKSRQFVNTFYLRLCISVRYVYKNIIESD